MRVYIAGPMTDMPGLNHAAFAAAYVALLEAGLKPFSPSYLPPPCVKPTWEDWMKAAIPLMLTCDAVALLPGWQKSTGAKIENELAVKLGMRVQTVDEWLEAA